MKSRLQKKEFFVPFSGGADTGGDPRLPNSPTITVENVDFNVDKVAKKRTALGTFVGNQTTDVPTAFSVDKQMAIDESSNSIIFFGTSFYESTTGGGTSNSYGAENGVSDIVDIKTTTLRTGTNSALPVNPDRVDMAWCQHSSGENAIMYSVRDVYSSDMLVVTGENSRRELATEAVGVRIIDPETNDSMYAIQSNGTNLTVYSWDGSTLTNTSAAMTTAMEANAVGATYYNDGGATDKALVYGVDGTNFVISSVRMTNSQTIGSVNYAVESNGSETAFDAVNLDDNWYLVFGARWYDSYTKTRVHVSAVSADESSINVAASAKVGASGFTNGYPYYVSGWKTSDTTAQCLIAQRDRDTGDRVLTQMSTVTWNEAGPTVSFGAFANVEIGAYPISQPVNIGGDVYVVFNHFGDRTWNTTNTDADRASAQSFQVLYRYTNSTTAYKQFVPVGTFNESSGTLFNPTRGSTSPRQFRRFNDVNAFASIIQLGESGPSYHTNGDVSYGGDYDLRLCEINTTSDPVKSIRFGDDIIIPGSLPMVYNGSEAYPAGAIEYPEGVTVTLVATGGQFSNAGGPGVYHYSAVYRTVDSFGNETESAPSPSVNVTIASNVNSVTVNIISPNLTINRPLLQGKSVFADVYRTSADGNDFFLIGSVNCATQAQTVTLTDEGTKGFTATSGLDTLLSAKALYTQNGELEAVKPFRHKVACSHAGRYVYAAGSSAAYYSKSYREGVAVEFNDILRVAVPSIGGDIKAMESFQEKLYIGKDRAWMVTYGEPLNDTGAGQGFAPPRIITQEAGVKYPTAAAAGSFGIFFVNSVDGLLYLLGGDEQVKLIGAQVRHYCETYDYNNVWYAPQDSCVRFSSATVGAPTLSFNYKYGKWSTFTGRYDDGIRAAFSAPVGASNAMVDVVMDTNGKVYFQNDSATVESFNVNISTSWISLNDIAGYGRFYKWTLIGGKKNATLNLNLKTAYDYEAYWTDNQTFSANSLEASEIADQYGAMTDANFVDNALKLDVDGSRHKTDAVRLCVSTNAGTARDDIEILGARLEIGVKPGSTRLGSGRTVS